MKNKLVLGVIVLAVIIGGLFFLGFVPGTGAGSDMEIIFYDAEGNELGRTDTRLSTFGIQRDGFEGDIHSLFVCVYFEVTTDIDYGWITTGCWLTVVTRVASPTAGIVHTVDEHRLGAVNTDESGTFYATYLMSDLLPAAAITEDQKQWGWSMGFSARLETDLGFASEETHTVSDTCGTTLRLVWSETLVLDSWFGDW